MKLGRECEWEDLKVGEVFAFEGCMYVLEKKNEREAFILADSEKGFNPFCKFKEVEGKVVDINERWGANPYNITIGKVPTKLINIGFLHKLDKRTQTLWKTE